MCIRDSYDSQTGDEVLGNHADRPEVQEAEAVSYTHLYWQLC